MNLMWSVPATAISARSALLVVYLLVFMMPMVGNILVQLAGKISFSV